MASGRFISNTLGDSERFSSLTDPRYQVAFVLIVTWADAEGRFIADPITLNGKLFTRLGWTPDVVRAALEELRDVGLVCLYDVDGKPYGVVAKFHEHNTITRKNDGSPAREAASKLPAPPEPCSGDAATPAQQPRSRSTATVQQPRTNRAAITPEVEVQVQVEVEGKRTHSSEIEKPSDAPTLAATPPRSRTHDPGQFMEAWNQHRGRLPAVTTMNSKRKSAIRALVKEHGPDQALELFRDAVRAVARDDFWLERQYGLDTLLTGNKILQRAEQWRNGTIQLGPANTKLAANVDRWSKALPPDPTEAN